MKKREQHDIEPRDQSSNLLKVLMLFLVLLASLTARAQNGNGMNDAIPMGNFNWFQAFYEDYRNTSYHNGVYYDDNYNSTNYGYTAQPSSDVWYSFSVGSVLDFDLSLCGSSFDTYIHIIDEWGNEVASNNDDPACGTASALYYPDLPIGNYYLVVEGNGWDFGDYGFSLITMMLGSPPAGATMNYAVDAGTLLPGGTAFSDTRSNDDPGLGNSMGQPSRDLYYEFKLTSAQEVELSHCGSAIDTYMHLLNSSGTPLMSNDDSSVSPCPGTRAYIKTTLAAGTYYVMSEGKGSAEGYIQTTIGLAPPAAPPVISYSGPVSVQVGTALSLLPTNTGAATYSISPALPAGLVINTATGLISGTPTVVSPATVYTVTASNTAGSGTATISIQVVPAPVQLGNDKNYIRILIYREPFVTAPVSASMMQAMANLTYFDGLGRELQQVVVNGNQDGAKDVVVPVSYDFYGRKDKDYLPYATTTGVGGVFKGDATAAQASFYNTPPVGVVQIPIVGGVTPSFGKTVFEASPLDRVLEQGAPGAAWQPAEMRGSTGRTVATEQTINNEIDFADLDNTRKVLDYRVVLSSSWEPALTVVGVYPAGQLLVNITKDENWVPGTGAADRLGTVEEYKDKQGRVVLKRTFNKNGGIVEMLSTYYVYDDFGNLSIVLPPGTNPDIVPPSESTIDVLGYRYRYDGRNRMVEKKLPSKGVEYIIYNEYDQVVAVQDANQRTANQWLVTKYDALGRMVLTSIWNNGNAGIARDALQTQVNGQSLDNLKETRTATGNGYTNVSWPTSSITDTLTVQYYDNYDIPGLLAIYKPSGYSMMTKGLTTVTKVNVLGTTNMLWNVSHYDDNGQVVRQFSQHYKGGIAQNTHFDDISNQYSFTGLLERSIRKHHAGSASVAAVTVTTEQTYDHRDRPLDTWTTVNSGTRTLVARNGYNEIGQQISKKLGSTDNGASFGQTVDYAYNERGWTKEIVSPLFKQYLKYNEGPAPQYNGNVSSQEFTRYNLTLPTPVPATDNYSYTYDYLDRLKEGSMVNDKGRETMTYDRMGNINTLTRTGITSAVVDQLTYSYSGNRLTGVSDAVAGADPAFPYHYGGTTAYTYDANGNMKTRINTTHTGNNITAISYNHLNLPSSVTATGGNVTYVYDANGRKLRSTNGIQGQTRDYIDGIEYVAGTIELIHHGEGRILNTGGSYVFEYYLKDHLGNNRSGFGAGVNVTKPDFSADYYPFGMRYQQYVRLGNPKNNYLYNGKELQDGLKLYDYGARLYDTAIGRWGTVDPLAEQYENVSAYNYALNNPIKYIDPDGRSVFTSSNLGDIENLLNQAKMLDAMNGDEDEVDQDDPKKKGKLISDDKHANRRGERPVYDGRGYFGTNFLGPGPEIDPAETGLEPKDMIDRAAFYHDRSYYKARVTGVSGAFFSSKVRKADRILYREAMKISKLYREGGHIDPVTKQPISEYTYSVANAVIAAFGPISSVKDFRYNINILYKKLIKK